MNKPSPASWCEHCACLKRFTSLPKNFGLLKGNIFIFFGKFKLLNEDTTQTLFEKIFFSKALSELNLVVKLS